MTKTKQDRETYLTNQVPKIIINDNTVVPYPEDELADLDKCLELNGFLKQAKDHTGLSPNTIKGYILIRQGEYKKVNDLRLFVKGFINAYSQPAA